MDISIQATKKSPLRRYWPIIIPVLGALIAIVIVSRSFGSATYVVDRDKLVFGKVQRGDFSIQVRGVGVLVPKNIQFLASNVDGRVDSIAVEAGAVVNKGDVVATLSNPKLHEQLEEARWELEAQTKEHRASEAALRSQLVDLRVEARNAELEFESAKLKLDAEQTLVERGIVSKLQFEQSKLTAQQQKERITSARERVGMMQANLDAQIEAHAARLNKIRNSNNLIQQQIDESEKARQTVEKQQQRLVNENKALKNKLESNKRQKANLEKAIQDNEAEYITLLKRIDDNNKAQDSVAVAAEQIRKVVDAHTEKQKNVN